MDRKEAIDLALNLFRKDLDKNDVVKTPYGDTRIKCIIKTKEE